MKIEIIAVGKIGEKYLKKGIEEYIKRIKKYAKVTIIEIADERIPKGASIKDERAVREREGEKILQKVNFDSHIIALDIHGKQFSSEELAGYIENMALEGRSNFTFIIGGSLGLAEAVLKKANLNLSFGMMTFPHQLMRLILLEQIYRSFKIMRGETYHK